MGYLSAVVADGPRALWLLGEASGTVAAEFTGNPFASAGTFNGSPTLGTAGIVATGAAVQTGASSYVRLPLPDLGVFASFEFVFKYVSGGGKVFRNDTGTWAFDLSGTNPVVTCGGTAHTFTGLTSASLKDGARHHIVIELSATSATFYVDGAKVGSSFTSAGTASGNTFYLGKDGLNATFSPAKFAAAAVYGYALGASRVAAHYAVIDDYQLGFPTVTVTAQPLEATFPSITVISVEPQTLVVTRPVVTASSLVLSSTTVNDIEEPLTEPALVGVPGGGSFVEPAHIVSVAVPAPTLVDGRPT